MIIIILFIFICQIFVNAETGICGNDCKWELKDEVLTISGNGDIDDFERFEGSCYPIVQRDDIKSVIIEDGIKYIGAFVFNLFIELRNVVIPSSVTMIGASSFASCYKLTNITIPSSVRIIDDHAFTKCTSLKKFIVDPNNKFFFK